MNREGPAALDPSLKGRWNPERDPLRDLRGGDARAFEDFVRCWTPDLRSFFRRLGALPAEADDLVQETFLKLYRHAATYEAQGRFVPFAFRVARNAWIDRQRRRAVRPVAVETELADEDRLASLASPDHGPLREASGREELDRLRLALLELSESHRLVFELGVLQERPYSEIAGILDIPVGTVKSRMFHAVRRLRAVLEPEEDPS